MEDEEKEWKRSTKKEEVREGRKGGREKVCKTEKTRGGEEGRMKKSEIKKGRKKGAGGDEEGREEKRHEI